MEARKLIIMSGSTVTANGVEVEVDGLDLDMTFEEFNRGIILPIVIPEDGPIRINDTKFLWQCINYKRQFWFSG